MHAGDLARRDFKKFRLNCFFGDYWFDGFGNIVEREAQAVCHHGDRFRQAVMLDYSRGDLLAKFIRSHSRTDFFLQRQTALGCIDDAHGAHPVNALCDRAER